MWSWDKRVSSNHHSFAGFGVNRLVTARVYYILLVSAISFYYLSIISMSVYKQVLLLIYLQCDGELSRFFPATWCEEQRHFRVFVFASISKWILIMNLTCTFTLHKSLFTRKFFHQEFVYKRRQKHLENGRFMLHIRRMKI